MGVLHGHLSTGRDCSKRWLLDWHASIPGQGARWESPTSIVQGQIVNPRGADTVQVFRRFFLGVVQACRWSGVANGCCASIVQQVAPRKVQVFWLYSRSFTFTTTHTRAHSYSCANTNADSNT